MQRIFAFLLLIIASPIALLVSCMVVMSGFPIFFRQSRIGVNKTNFIIFKFRSMKDGKITTVGKIIRKTGLDEIPQLLNIIRGEMNFVGPRPLTQSDVNRLNWEGEDHSIRWKVLPGITGPAQLVTVCDADVSFRNDVHYINNKSFGFDLKLFVLSCIIPFTGKNIGKKLIRSSTYERTS